MDFIKIWEKNLENKYKIDKNQMYNKILYLSERCKLVNTFKNSTDTSFIQNISIEELSLKLQSM